MVIFVPMTGNYGVFTLANYDLKAAFKEFICQEFS